MGFLRRVRFIPLENTLIDDQNKPNTLNKKGEKYPLSSKETKETVKFKCIKKKKKIHLIRIDRISFFLK